VKRLLPFALAVLLAFAAWWWFRGDAAPGQRSEHREPPLAGAPSNLDALLARERAAAHFESGELRAARAELAPLLAIERPELDDLVRAAIVDYADRPASDPEPLFARLRALAPERPELRYMEARVALERGDFEAAREHFAAVLRARPDDRASQVGLASTLLDLGRAAEARPLLADVLALGPEVAGPWYAQSVYLLLRLAQREGPAEDAQRLQQLYAQLEQLGVAAPSGKLLDQGDLARVRPPRPAGVVADAPPRAPEFVLEPAVLPELAGARELFVHDLDQDGDADFLAASARGLFAAFRGSDGFVVERLLEGPVEHVRALDLGNRDSLDLIACRGADVLLFEHASGAELLLGEAGAARWTLSPLALPRLPSPPSDLLFTDHDHDGDLDVLLVGAFGARLWRNDGAAPRPDARGVAVRGAFTDVSAEASLPVDVALAWCATEDFDGDSDVDLLLGGPNALFLMDNLRAGRFADLATRAFGAATAFAREPLLVDCDADGRPDVLAPGEPSTLRLQRADGTFAPALARRAVPSGATPLALDVDQDGLVDVAWAGAGASIDGELAFGTASEAPFALAGAAEPDSTLVAADLDRDLDSDFARATARGVEVLRCVGPVGHAARLQPLGLKDNRRAVGAVIEVRTRGLYRRIYWRGEPELVGCGPHPKLDVVRTTWPNGAVQTLLDVPPTDRPFLDAPSGGLLQSSSLVGSCPFLYAWNGERFGFVSDVLGGTPLGLPMAPGMLVPPDHDEFVLVRGDQLVARDGVLELQFTEELREVTYLDRARLDVVDHPVGVAVYPNERFTFPPFPAPHLHTVEQPLAPTRAFGSDGRDWTRELARIDDVHAVPFAPLEPQFLGLATPHWLELEFEPALVRDAAKLRLVCTGWFFWSDASVNMASARTPGVAFVPPIVQLLGADGAWHDAGPPVGFPAGKSKTMVIDLPAGFDRARPKLRLFSTLRLYWDALELAVDADDAPTRITSLEPAGARLWPRGFSRPIATGRTDLPERFEWEALATEPRWNQHPGRYTRYGETVALLGAADDRFVILGSGDALTLRFDARGLPPLAEGWTRDYLLYLDGWAKDRDPNTVEALNVEPLPFHGMSGYPYRADERFPDGPEHTAWRAEWNTREARRLLAPLAPRALTEWARELGAGPPVAR
jgi:tetratricopeptide (TPR) repeat protein